MDIIRETYRQYEIWCRPIKRNIYRFGEIKGKKLSESAEGTTALLRKMREKERRLIEASGVLLSKQPDAVVDDGFDEYTGALSTTADSYPSAAETVSSSDGSAISITTEEALKKLPEEYQPRLKRLRSKVQNAIFDYSEIEQERIEKEIDDLVNSDGYYNEIDPIDIDVEYEKESLLKKPFLIAVAGFIIYVIVILSL